MPRLLRSLRFRFRNTNAAAPATAPAVVAGGALGAVAGAGSVGSVGPVGAGGAGAREDDIARLRRESLYVGAGLLCFAVSSAGLVYLDSVLTAVQLSSSEVLLVSLAITCPVLLVGLECFVIYGRLSRPEATRLALLNRFTGGLAAFFTDTLTVPADEGDGDDGGDPAVLEIA